MVNTDFDRIYLDQSKASGRMRIAELGLGWKASGGDATAAPFLLPQQQLSSVTWLRALRGYELRIHTKSQGVVLLDGFDADDFASLKLEIQRNFNLVLEHREHALRGWNWGKTDLARNELVFSINNKPAFEVPYARVSNSNLTGKNEVAVEFNLETAPVGDELVEMRLYVPGTVESGSGDGETNPDAPAVEETSAASVFYEQLKEKADIGQVAGDAIVSFLDILFLTPRGRYDIDMYPTSLRLRGKTYDYKIQYSQIERIFALPKPDETHNLVVLQIDPPLRQGQTRYPFLVMQFVRDEETELDLNVDDDEYESKYKERLKKHYDLQTHLVVSHCFKGLTMRRLVVPSQFQLRFMQPGFTCSLKASEGILYPLERCFLFVTKPTVYIPFSEISNVTLTRTGGGVSASRTFDLEINLRGGSTGGQLHVFGAVDREEQDNIEKFCLDKGIRVKNEEKLAKAMMARAISEAANEDDEDGDVDMGSANDDGSESDDGDFQAMSELDPAEEFDSDVPASGSDDEGEAEPPKKKSKAD